MKENETPNKIHIGIRPSEFGGCVLTTVDKDFPNAVEYTHTDAFIEKAIEWLKKSITNNPECNRIISLNGTVTMGMLIEDFRNYMKGQ